MAPDPAGNPLSIPVTATAGLKGFPVDLPLSDISPDQAKREAESTPQPLGGDLRGTTLGGDATLEKESSIAELDEGATPQLGPPSEHRSTPRHLPPAAAGVSDQPTQVVAEERDPYGPPVPSISSPKHIEDRSNRSPKHFETTEPTGHLHTDESDRPAALGLIGRGIDQLSSHPRATRSSTQSPTRGPLATLRHVQSSGALGPEPSTPPASHADASGLSSIHAEAQAPEPPPEAEHGRADADKNAGIPTNTPPRLDTAPVQRLASKSTPAAKMKYAFNSQIVKFAAFAGLAAGSALASPSTSLNEAQSGRSGDGLPVEPFVAATGTASQLRDRHQALDEAQSGRSGDGLPVEPFVAATGTASQYRDRHQALDDAQFARSGDGLPVEPFVAATGRASQQRDRHQPGQDQPMQPLVAAQGEASQPSGSAEPLTDACTDAIEYYDRILPLIQSAQLAKAEGRTVEPTMLAILPVFTRCPLDEAHKASLALCAGAIGGCLSRKCPARRGIQRYGEQSSSIRYLPCAACHFWAVAARADGCSDGATPRYRARCFVCGFQPAQSLNWQDSCVTHRSPAVWMTLDEGNTVGSIVSLHAAIYSNTHSQRRWANLHDACFFDSGLLRELFKVNAAALTHQLTRQSSELMIDRAARAIFERFLKMLPRLSNEVLVEVSAQLQLGAEMASRYLLPQQPPTEQSIVDALQVGQDLRRAVAERFISLARVLANPLDMLDNPNYALMQSLTSAQFLEALLLNSPEEHCVKLVQSLRRAGLLDAQHEYANTPTECLPPHIQQGETLHRGRDARPPPANIEAYSDAERSRDSSSQRTTGSSRTKSYLSLGSDSSTGIHCVNAGEVVEAVLKLKGPEGLSQVVQEAFKRSPELLPEEPAQSLSADLSSSPTRAAISYPTRERRPPQRLSPTGSALAGNQSVSTDLGSSPQTVPDVIADIRWHLGTKTSREQAEQLYQAVQLARWEDADPSNATLEILANLGFHGKAAVRKVHKVLEVVKANDDYQGPDDTNSMTSSSTNTTCRTTTEEPTPSRTPASLTTWLQAPSTSSPGLGSRPPHSSPWWLLPSTHTRQHPTIC